MERSVRSGMGNSMYSVPTSLMSDFTKIGFVAYSGIFLALDKMGLGRHQWDISLLDFTELNPVRVFGCCRTASALLTPASYSWWPMSDIV